MSISEEILKTLNTPVYHCKGIPVNIIGLPIFKKYKKQSVRNSFSKLQAKNFIRYEGAYVKITEGGKKFLKKRSVFLPTFESKTNKKSKKDLLLLFDIEEKRKAEREWLRRQLVRFGYEMIQKSVWVGPYPLPSDFIDYLKKIKINQSIKTFRLSGDYKK